MDIGPPKYKEGDYVRIRFGSGHCKAMINNVKRNKGWDKMVKESNVFQTSYWIKQNPNGWHYQVAKHYGTGTGLFPDFTNSHWSRNLKLEIIESEVMSVEDMPVKEKLQYLYEGMLPNTFNVLKALI
tara:strand:- start:620 stop:1000 length:381 start_codon:yes stop_codon:yes gene_type:complete